MITQRFLLLYAASLVLLSACRKSESCIDPNLVVKFNGFDSADLAVYSIARCKKGSGLSNLVSRTVTGTMFKRGIAYGGDTSVYSLNEYGRDSLRDHGHRIESGYDYLIDFYRLSKQYRITDISIEQSERSFGKDDYAPCTNSFRYQLDGGEITIPIRDRPRASDYSYIILNR